jgi:hypothetical protein
MIIRSRPLVCQPELKPLAFFFIPKRVFDGYYQVETSPVREFFSVKSGKGL